MSVASQITRLQTAKNNLRTVINSKLTSGLLTTSDSISNYASAVNRIPTNTPITDPEELMQRYVQSIGGVSTGYLRGAVCSTSLSNGGFTVDIIDRSTFTLRFKITDSSIMTVLGWKIAVIDENSTGAYFYINPFLADYISSSGSLEPCCTNVSNNDWPISTRSIINAWQFDWCLDPTGVAGYSLYFRANEVWCYYLGYEI